MANNNDVTIRIGAELRGIKEALAGLGQQMEQFGQKAVESSNRANQASKKHEDSITHLKKQVVELVAAYASFESVKGLAKLADDAKNMDARLKLATRSAQEHLVAQKAIFEIAQRTSSSLVNTADLYSRISIATKEMSFSQKTLLDITETINKAVQLSGSSSEAANDALIQLGQGLASGTLRGDELNSVMEQTPRLARAIAEGMGITIGQLRQMGQDGKITAETIVNALTKQKGVVDAEFGQMPETIGRAVTKLENNFMHLVSTMDASTGATATIARAIGVLADHLSEIVQITGILGTVIVATYVTKAIPAITAYIAQTYLAIKANKEFGASMTKSQKAFSLFAAAVAGWEIGTYLEQNFTIVKQAGIALMSGLQTTWAKLVGFFREMGASLEFLWTHPFDSIRESIAHLFEQLGAIAAQIPGVGAKIAEAANAAANMARSKSDAAQKYRAEVAKIHAETAAEVKQIDDIYSEMFANAGKAQAAGNNLTPSDIAPAGTAKKNTKAGAVDQLAVERAEVQREMALLDQAYAEAKKSHADYYEERKQLTIKEIDLEIAEHQKALAKISESDSNAKDQRSKEMTDIALLERKKNDIRIDANHARIKAEKDTADKVAEAERQLAAAKGKIADAASGQIETKYRDLIKRLTVEGDTHGLAIVEELISVEKAQAQLNEIAARAKKTMDTLGAKEQSSQARVITGDTAPATGEAEQKQARDEALQSLIALRAELEATGNTSQQAKDEMASLDQQIADISIKNANGLTLALINLRAEWAQLQKDFASKTVSAATDSLATFFESIANGTKSGKEALVDFVRSFAQSMVQIASRALATYVVLQTLDAIYPGLGKATAASMGAGVHHTGGIAGAPSVRRDVPAFLFAGAPRYHTGGVAGLAPNEVPAILQKGEEVLTKDDPRHVNNGGGQTSGGVRILNVVDPAMVHDYMSSSSGEQVVLNTISRNPGAIKQILSA